MSKAKIAYIDNDGNISEDDVYNGGMLDAASITPFDNLKQLHRAARRNAVKDARKGLEYNYVSSVSVPEEERWMKKHYGNDYEELEHGAHRERLADFYNRYYDERRFKYEKRHAPKEGAITIDPSRKEFLSLKRLSDKKFQKGTSPLAILINLNHMNPDNVAQKRLMEYYFRRHGGYVRPIPSVIKEARKDLKDTDESGINLYARIVGSDEPIKELIWKYDNINHIHRNTHVYTGDWSGFTPDNQYDLVDVSTSVNPLGSLWDGQLTSNVGPYKRYLKETYPDREVRSYIWPTPESVADKETEDRLNRYSSERGDNSVVLYDRSIFGNPLLLKNSTGPSIMPDVGNYVKQYIQDDDGKIYVRSSDVYDFEPNLYSKIWGASKKAMKRVNNYINPVVILGPWAADSEFQTWDDVLKAKQNQMSNK